MLFETALRYGLKCVPSTFVDSLCTDISLRVLWIFYDSIIQSQTIKLPKQFVLFLECVYYLGLNLVHLFD